MDKSFITKAIDIIRGAEGGKNYKVYMIVAPSIASQLRFVKLGQVVTGIKQLGVQDVVEAALGADIVAMNEARDLAEEGMCTSSCCPAFVRYVKQAYPTLASKVSNNLSPMAAIGKYIKSTDPTAKCVFVGPCIAKKMEIQDPDVAPYIDCVITFEELAVLFEARHVDLASLPESPLDNASYFGRIFARAGGLSEAVKEALTELGSDFEVKPVAVNGLDQCRMALNQAKIGKLQGNFIEGMACPGGCIGGPSCLLHEMRDAAQVDKYGKESKEQTIRGAIDAIMADPRIATKHEEE